MISGLITLFWITNCRAHVWEMIILFLLVVIVALCLLVGTHEISFFCVSMNIGIIIAHVLLKYYGWTFPIVSRKHNLTADFAFLCIFQSFHSPLLRCPLTLRYSSYIEDRPTGTGSHTIGWSVYYDLLWFPLMVSVICKEWLLWKWATFICGFSDKF